MNPLLLFPDFALIALGWVLRRSWLNKQAWEIIEKLVYFLLFPCLLFISVYQSNFSVSELGTFALSSPFIILSAFLMGWLYRPLSGLNRIDFAAGLQTAYRFNTYIGLALISTLAGDEGVAAFAILVALGVPLCNLLAVTSMSRGAPFAVIKEVLSNPLIIGTSLGIAAKIGGIQVPEPLVLALDRLSSAAVALGLLAVGAGLIFKGLQGQISTGLFWLSIKLVISPLLAIAYSYLAEFNTTQATALFVFAAIPSASSAFILASRMGANAGLVACLISLSTIGAAFTIPVLIALLP